MTKGIFFTDDYTNYKEDSSFIGVLPKGIDSKETLLKNFWHIFLCPHGGISWDSLDEILSDLSWLEATRVLIVHQDIPKLPKEELKKYLDVLKDRCYLLDDKHVQGFSPAFRRPIFDGIIAIFPKDTEAVLQQMLTS